MKFKTEGIKKFKDIMDLHENAGVPQEGLLGASLVTLSLLQDNSYPSEKQVFQWGYNYAIHLRSLSLGSTESRTAMREEVKAMAEKMVKICANRKASQKLPEEYDILHLRLYTLVNSLDFSAKRAAIVELLRIEPTGELDLFIFVEKYPMVLREAYSYVR